MKTAGNPGPFQVVFEIIQFVGANTDFRHTPSLSINKVRTFKAWSTAAILSGPDFSTTARWRDLPDERPFFIT